MEKKIEDFGNKIGGARKDTWKARGLSLDDVAQMTNNEKVMYIVKDEIWRKPDYRAMRAEGMELVVIYFIKCVRDAVPTKPAYRYYDKPEDTEKRQSEYIEFVTDVRDAVMACRKVGDIAGVSDLFERKGYSVLHGGFFTETRKAPDLLTSKLHAAVMRGTPRMLPYLERELKRKMFLYTETEKILAAYDFIKMDPANCHVEEKRMAVKISGGTHYYYFRTDSLVSRETVLGAPAGTFMVANGCSLISGPFDTEEAAREFVLAFAKLTTPENRKKQRKTPLSPPVLGTLIRKGPEDYRGWRHATGEMYLDTFGFYGGEFGNWLNEEERQANLNYGFDAFMDLSRILGIDETSISLGGELSIAFGARGKGNALAHFEPLRNVINLTKMRGAGSLGHEFMHALDYYVGKYEPVNGRAGMDVFASEVRGSETWKLISVLIYAKSPLDGEYTKFYRDAQEIDKNYSKSGHGYWSSNVELFARAGAAYLKDKGLDIGIRNDYLTGHADQAPCSGEEGFIFTSPQGEEREHFNKAFDAYFENLKLKGLLKRAEKIEAEIS